MAADNVDSNGMLPPPPPEMLDPARSERQLLPSSSPSSSFKNLLLIDSRVQQYGYIISSLNNDTGYIVFDYFIDTFETLKNKIAEQTSPEFESVGIVQHNYELPTYQLLHSAQPSILTNVEIEDGSLVSWNETTDFCIFLQSMKQTKKYDLLACNTYSNPNWVYVINNLETHSGIEIRASSDNTGWGGNWILESDNVDLTNVYFTEMIKEWQFTLGTSITSNITLTQASLSSYTWPISIDTTGVIVKFSENLTFTNVNQYFIIGNSNITIDGSGNTVTIQNVSNYPGLVKNDSGSNNNITVQNIGVLATGTTSLQGYCGWIGQQAFGNYATNCVIQNCYSTGTISDGGGGICGNIVGNLLGNLSITNCYSTGTITGSSSGGICGSNAGRNNGIVSITNCYSTGTISGSGGGICGSNAGNINGSVSITNCYSTGTNVNGGGGICANINGTQTRIDVSGCYVVGTATANTQVPKIFGSISGTYTISRTGWELNASPTWKNTNASQYLTNIGNNWTNTSNVWFEFLPNPGIPYLLRTMFTDMAAQYTSIYTASIFKTTGFLPYDLQTLYYAGNTLRLFSDATVSAVGYSDADYKTPYNIVAPNPQNQQVVISFTQDTSGVSITGYQYSLDSSASWQNASTNTSPITITGLTNGQTYSIYLRAVVSGAAYSYSTSTNSFTAMPQYMPNAPTGLSQVSSGVNWVSVNFTDGSNNGSTITNYQYLTDASSNWITVSTSKPIIMIGFLTADTSYNIQLRAVNAMGSGISSSILRVGTTSNYIPTVLNPIPGNNVDGTLWVLGSTHSFSYTVPSNTFYDADVAYGDVLTYSLVNNNLSWLTFNPSTRVLTASGDMPSTSATYPITIRAMDTYNSYAEASFNVIVYNVIPNIITTSCTITQGDVLRTPNGNWPVSINTSGVIVKFAENLTLYSYYTNQYFIINNSNITIDGSGNTVSINNIANYAGLVSNSSRSKNNITVKNIGVLATGTTTLAANGGWIGQQYYSRNNLNNIIINCYSTGAISNNGGGICGQYSGDSGNLTITNCYSTGDIKGGSGGICGFQSGLGGNISISNCYSRGMIGDGTGSEGGGICGGYTINSSGSVSITNCYSTGNVWSNSNARGICGYNSGPITVSNCYAIGTALGDTQNYKIGGTGTISNTGWELNASPTWKNTNASLYLTNAGNNLATNSNVWLGFLPNPGVPYLLQTNFTDMAASYPSTYSASIFKTTGVSPNDLKLLYYAGNTLRLFSDATVSSLGYSDTDYKTPYNIVVAPNPQNQRVVISFTQDTSGVSITGYQYSLDISNNWQNASTNTSPITITGLTYGQTYSIYLRAIVSGGVGYTYSTSTNSFTAMPQYMPNAPTALSHVSSGANWVSVNFIDGSNNASTITNYQYTIDAGTNWITVSASKPIIITGLTSDSTYNVQIRAVNAMGSGAASAVLSVGTINNTPINLSQTNSGANWVSISFTGIVDSVYPITNYQYLTDASTNWITRSPVSTSSPLYITGLPTVDTSYNVQLRAVNSMGSGVASSILKVGTVDNAPFNNGSNLITNQTFVYDTSRNGSYAINTNNFSDIDVSYGDVLTYSLQPETAASYTWLSLNPSTVVLSWTSIPKIATNYTIYIRATDRYSKYVDVSFILQARTQLISASCNISQNDVLNTYVWPVTIDTSGVIVKFAENLTFTDISKNFIIGNHNVSVDGSGNIVTIQNVVNYPGLLRNGVSSTQGKNNITIQNIGLSTTGTTTLLANNGWFGQQYFGYLSTNNVITNCYSTGTIVSGGGGICGQYAGKQGTLSITNCYSTGDISGNDAGGICGQYGAQTGNLTISNCYSTGLIRSRSGGICGSSAGYSSGTTTITNCYSTGNILDVSAGGICGSITGELSGTVIASRCYVVGSTTVNTTNKIFGSIASNKISVTSPNTGFETNASPTWNNANAATYLTNIGNNLTNGTNIWLNFSPSPGVPYLLKSIFTNMAASKPSVYTSSLFKSSGYAGIDLRNLYYLGNTTRLFSDAALLAGGYSDVDYKAPYNLSVANNPQNQQAVISFSQDTSGVSITRYQYSLDSSTNWVNISGSITSPITITGLTNARTYSIYLRAVVSGAAYTYSSATGEIFATPLYMPYAPTKLSQITSTSSSVSVIFTDGSNNGYAITNYQYSIDNGTNWITRSPINTTSPILITGLPTTNTLYNLKLRAINFLGMGMASSTLIIGTTSINGVVGYLNNPTVLNPIPTLYVLSTTHSFSYTIPSNTFYDADVAYGDVLTYSLVGTYPAWLTFNPSTRVLTATGDMPSTLATYPIVIRATDTINLYMDTSFNISVVNYNSPTVLNPIPSLYVLGSTHSFSYTIPSNTFYDADISYGDVLTYSLVGTYPAWLTFNPSTRVLTASGDMPSTSAIYPIIIRATDITALFADVSFNVFIYNLIPQTISSSRTISQYEVLNTPIGNWPVYINTGISVKFTENLTFTNVNQYFIISASGITIDGSENTVSIENVANYNGLVSNTSASKNNITVQKIGVLATGTTTLAVNAGWIGGPNYGYSSIGNVITKCYSNGNISSYGGGICGYKAGEYYSQLTISYCYSIGNIGNYGGGICGYQAGLTSALLVINNCYSMGSISFTGAGGICGGELGSGSSDIRIQRCYVVGTGNANNIDPKIIGPSTFGWAPTNSGWEPNNSPTWKNANASLYLTDQGSIWFTYLPDPGKRYDFLTSSNTGTSPYYNIIYNLTSAANPQNSQAVISFALNNSGITITRYQYSFDGINNWQNTSTSANTSPATITGLTNGQTYSIYLRAVLSGAAFPYTAASSPITVSPHYLSLAPINLSQVSSGSNWVSVNFTDVGFSDIPNTNYQYLTDASTNWITRSLASITSPIIISGLPTTDTSYNVQLRAVNSVGSGAASTILRVGTTSNNSPIILNPIPTLYVLSSIHSFSYTIPSNTFYDTDVLTYSLVNNNLSWLNIDSSTGILTATVDMPSTIAIYNIIIRATDTTNLFVDASFNVNVINNNSPTVLNPIPTLYVSGSTHSFSYTIPSNTFYDADIAYGDVLTYSLENNVLAWLTFNPSTRVLTASGDMPSTIATYPIIIRATDTSMQYVNASFNVITYNVITSSITTSRSISQADVFNTPFANWPISIDTSGVIVKFAENLTFTDSRQYFVIGTSNITIDGSGNTVTIQNVANYAGLVQNYSEYKNNITVKNIGVLATGTTTLASSAGWIGGSNYATRSTNNVILNCYSTGNLGVYGGGICGASVGSSFGYLSITNCYSTGNLAGYCGGICGWYAGQSYGNVSITKCYSTGNVNGSGGICGYYPGENNGIVSITNCYSTGNIIGSYAGGICGSLLVTQPRTSLNISNCYVVGTASTNTTVNKILGSIDGPYTISSTGWEPNSSPTWKNANASLYLTGINSTTWFSYLPDPGKRYDFLTSSNTGTSPYYVLYDISAAANPQNQQAVISFGINSLSSIGGTVSVIEYSLNGIYWATTNTNTSPAIIYGLTNGQTYTIYLRAVLSGISSYSYSIVSDPITVTPIYTPDAPTGITKAGSGTNWVSLSFTSGSNNGSTITNYQYAVDNSSNWITRSPVSTTSPITITGLSQDTSYNIWLRAVNSMGSGTKSDVIRVSTINNTPTGLSLTQSGTKWVSVSFTGISDTLYPTTNYEYAIDNSGTWYTRSPISTASPILISGLTTQDTSYNIWLRAVNSIGSGTKSNVLGVRTINNTPTGLSLVQSGNYWVSINFTGVSDGLYSTVNYQYSINNGSTWLSRSPVSSVSPIIIQNLPTINTTYNVKLRAVDTGGSSGLASTTIEVGTANNSPTVLNPIPTLVVSYIIHSFSYTIPANTFTDIDIPYSSETLTYSLIGTYPAWLTFVPSTRVLTGSTSMPSTFTDYIITIRATDNSSLYADASFVIQVRNPTISASRIITQNDVLNLYAWPITINTSGVVVSFAENLTFTNINQYFIIGAPNITIDGSGHTVSLNTPINYPGLIQNGNYNNSILGNNGTTIKNIGIIATGSTTLAPLGGWLAQTGFGYSSTNNIIQNCYSNGDIASYGGGICGQFSGQAGTLNIIYCYSTGAIASYGSGGICGQFSGQAGTLTITTCYSTGAIASDAGGICGSYIGRYNGTVVISNCYSNGVINGINSGGICGSYAGFSNGSVSISNCYSIGAINQINAGGICGYNTGYIGTVLISNCYVVGTTTVNNNNKIFGSIASNNISVSSTNTGFETNGSSWNNVNASTYLTDLDVLWQGFVPDPGIPYLLKLYLGDVVGVYPATYPLSLFISSGSQASYLRSVYRSDITTRLFTDASLIELGFTDVDFKTPYNISVDPNPQNHQAVIRFTQDTVGVSITGYEYSLDSSSNWINASTSTSPITITGLTNAQTYSVYLRAVVSGADYTYSTTANAFSATPKYMPTAPTALSQYQSGSQWVSINLTDGSNNGFPITNYQYAIDNSTNWITASPANAISPIIVKGFSTSDTSYNVWLRAVNSLGVGDASILRVGTINNKPTGLSQYQSGSKWVSINFTNVIDTVYPTTNYQYSIDNSTNWITRSPASTASPLLISTGFATSDTSYNIWFRVVNSSPGTNNTSNVLRVGTINNKPTGLSQGQTGNYWMYINFTNVIDSVYPTTNYQYAIDNSANWITYSPATTSSPFFIPGFPTSDISYNLFFRTVNSSAGANDVSVLRVGTVDNPPIVANPIQNQTFVYDTIVNGSYTIPINTFYDIDVSYNVDNLTYSMVPLNSYPPWLTFSPSTRILTWTSIPKLSTNYTITIRATDVNSKFVDASFLLQARTQLISTSRDISQNDITQFYAWPVSITAPNTTVKFANNFTFTSISQYFIITSNGITIDGSGNTITLNTPINYPGLVSCSSGSKNNNTIQNIGIISTGSTTLIANGGWIGQSLFGSASTYTIINNCYSIGGIGVGGGGICGSNAGQNGILSITNCYNIGNIATNGGGICGLNSGQAGNLTISNCFSTGTIGSSAGGICGYACGFSTGIVSITNCYSTGTIVSSSSSGGGICGQYAGKQGTLTITNCYSTGDISGSDAGGICGQYSGDVSGNVSISNCYSTGVIYIRSGGICGSSAGHSSGTTTITNCYSTGNILDVSAGGICGYIAGDLSGTVIVSHCYIVGTASTDASTNKIFGSIASNKKSVTSPSTGFELNSSPTWKNTNAATYLTNIGNYLNNVSDVWLEFLPSPGVPYLLKSLMGDMVYLYSATYPLSLFISTGLQVSYLRSLYYFNNTVRLFSDDSLYSTNNYTDANFKAPYNLTAPIDDGKAVIRFSQDTSGVSITGYQYSLDSSSNWNNASTNTSPITIVGLTNKRAYSIYLRAVVSGASYTYSQESTSLNITPDAITTPPTRLSQNTSGYKWVSIIFTAVTNTSHPTTNYQYSINNGATWLTRSPVSAASPILIRDLPTADTSYNIQLRALSDIAPSTASSLAVIIVNNVPTVLNTIPNLVVSIDSPNFTYTIPSNTFTDIDLSYSTDVITYSLVQQPVLLSKLTYNPSTYLLTGSTIAALSVSTDFVITMRATDSGAKTSDASFILQTRKQRISTNTSISQSDILNNTYFWPVIIDTSGVVVTIAEDLTLSSATQYFVINADNVTLNGAGNTIRLYAINNYPGFVQNGTSSSQGKNNTILQNITVVSLLGTTTLAANGGWIGQSYFGRGLNTTSASRNIVITNCNSIGILNNSGCGGICGQYAGRYGNLTITNCYSTSDISGADCGGICGQFTGDSSGNVSLTNCYSTGIMSGTNVGGICGSSAGNTSGRVSLTSCYSTGAMSGSGSGGICGSSAGNTSGTVSLTSCYSTGIMSGSNVGGICGSSAGNTSGTVSLSNCYSTGAMSGTSSGGICGSSAGIAGKLNVSSCYTTGYITGSGAGGICGDSTGSSTGKVDISYCYTSGIIGGGSAGGICGSNAGITGNLNISNCFTIGDISGGDSGGICGLRTKTATIRNCYSAGAIKGINVGGICGSSAGYSTGTLTITNCYSTGDIIDASAGGICGYNTGDSSGTVLVSNCYVVGNTTGNTPTASIPYNKIFGTFASNKTSVLYPNSGYELNTSLWNNANANTYLIGVSNESVWVHNFTRNKGYANKTNLPNVERLRKYTAYDLYGAGYTNAQLLAFGYAQSDINNLPQGSMDISNIILFDSGTITATNNITYPSVKNSTTVSYQWYVRTLTSDISNNNAYMVVSGNDTTITYLLKGADYNKQIIVNASYTDSSNNVISVSSPFYNKWATFVFKVSSAEWAKNTNNIFPIINTNNSFKDVSYNSYTSNGTLTIPMYWSSFVDSGSSNNDGLHFYQNGAASYLTDSSFEIYNFYGAPLSRNTGQSFTNGIFTQFAGKITSSSIPTNMVPTILSNTSFSGVFYNCLSTQIGNIVNWDTSGVVNMSNAFYNASTFNQNIGSWSTQNVLNMSNMFCNANLFDQYIGGWNTANCTNMSNMFYNANLFNQNIGAWNTAKCINMSNMFYNATVFNQNIGAWNTAICTNMSNMFYNATVFNQLIDSSGSTSWNTASCTDMSNMFYNAKKFNKRIANWNTTNVSNMSNMFKNAVEFNQLIDTSGTSWNTASCTNMSNMFTDAMSFNQSIVNWNTLGVINMSGMFKRAIAFNQLINTTANKWNTSNCTNMSEMFLGAIKFNQTITNWNTAKVATMENMFFAAASFNQHVIGNWTFTLVSNMKNMIQYSGYDYNTYSTFLQDLSNNTSLPNNLILGNVSTTRIDDSSTTQLTSNAYTNLTKSVASGGKRMTIYDSSATLVYLIANPPAVRTVSISTNSNNLGNIGFGTLTTSGISSSTINPNHKCLVITL